MTERLKKLRADRLKLADEMRAITDLAEKENRDMTSEEIAKHKAIFTQVESKREQIEAEERNIEIERETAETEAERSKKETQPEKQTPEQRQMAAFRSYLQGGEKKLKPEELNELRALSAGSDPDGGYLVAPGQFVTDLLKNVDNAVYIRQKATKYQLASGTKMGVPSLDSDVDDADWTTEVATGNEDTGLKFGRRDFATNPLAKRIKVSRQLMRNSALPVEAIVRQRLAYKFAVSQEKAFLLGDGVKKPLGLFIAHNDGIPTSRDQSSGNTNTAVTFDGLISAKYSVKGQYWANASWLFHRDAMQQISKLKDSYGQYIWRPSTRDGEPDRILGHAVDVSEYVPNTFTTGLYVGLFGDLSNYWIADALDLQIQVLNELYAESNQIGMIGRLESDGMPVLAEAFARVKLT